jgi:hypothetical protein
MLSSSSVQLHWLRILARDLSARLNEAREATPGIWVCSPASRRMLYDGYGDSEEKKKKRADILFLGADDDNSPR